MSVWIALALSAQPCIPIPGDRLRAGDIAAAIPAFAAMEPDADLGPAPRAGVARHLLPADLRRLAARAGVRLEDAPAVCIQRTSILLTAELVEEAVKQAIPDARIEVLDFSRYPVPAGTLEFPPNTLPATPGIAARPFVWRGFLRSGSKASVPVWAKVRVVVRRTVIKAARTLEPGTPIESSDVRVEMIEAPPGPDAAVAIEELRQWTPRRTIQTGEVIRRLMLRPAPSVRGQTEVAVKVQSGTVQLGLTGRAETDAHEGEPVWVRLGNKRVRGVAAGKGMVIVNAEGEQLDASLDLAGGAGADGGDGGRAAGPVAKGR